MGPYRATVWKCRKGPRIENALDVLAHAAGESELKEGLQQMGTTLLKSCRNTRPEAVLERPVRLSGPRQARCGILWISAPQWRV